MITIQIPSPADPATIRILVDGVLVGGVRMVLIEGTRVQMHFPSDPGTDASYDRYSELLRKKGVQIFRNEAGV
jgi:hypothetical protein